jgi:hypothetical protein
MILESIAAYHLLSGYVIFVIQQLAQLYVMCRWNTREEDTRWSWKGDGKNYLTYFCSPTPILQDFNYSWTWFVSGANFIAELNLPYHRIEMELQFWKYVSGQIGAIPYFTRNLRTECTFLHNVPFSISYAEWNI